VNTIPHTAGQFRLPSKAEFGERSNRLAWLLGAPLQVSQNLLSRIYGFADLHALQKDLDRASKSRSDHPCGPYEDEVFAAFFGFSKGPDDPTNPVVHPSDRENRIIDLVRDYAERSGLKEVPPRFWDVRQIGLFQASST
jgi:hypothetical protein